MEQTTTTKAKTVNVQKIVESFVSSVDVKNEYTLDELKKILATCYKSSNKSSRKNGGEKREPSKYNLFVKDEMSRLKAEHPDKSFQEIMALAASNWKEKKASLANDNVDTE
jgi:hypothetical protein